MAVERIGKHRPSPVELGGFKRYVEEFLSYVQLYRETWIVPYGIAMPMNSLETNGQQILENIQVQQSESADIQDKQ